MGSRRIQKAAARNRAWRNRKLLYQNRWTENKVPVRGDPPTQAELIAAAKKAAADIFRPKRVIDGTSRITVEGRERRLHEQIVWHKIKTEYPNIFRFFHANLHYFVQYDPNTSEQQRRSITYDGLLPALAALKRGAVKWE